MAARWPLFAVHNRLYLPLVTGKMEPFWWYYDHGPISGSCWTLLCPFHCLLMEMDGFTICYLPRYKRDVGLLENPYTWPKSSPFFIQFTPVVFIWLWIGWSFIVFSSFHSDYSALFHSFPFLEILGRRYILSGHFYHLQVFTSQRGLLLVRLRTFNSLQWLRNLCL